jgi:hypothetical protein
LREFRRKSSSTRLWNSSISSFAVGAALHDPVREEPVAGELVEPAAGRPDPPPHRRHELVHDPGEQLEADRLAHQHRGLADVRGHHEHLEGLVVHDRVEQPLAVEPLLPVGRRVAGQQVLDPRPAFATVDRCLVLRHRVGA